MSQLRILNLSKNKLISLGSITQGLQNLEELWVRDNQLANLSTLQNLANCPSLARLALKPNPVCKLGQASSKSSGEPAYWNVVVAHVAQLQVLDGASIGPSHRAAATAFVTSPEGRQALRPLGYERAAPLAAGVRVPASQAHATAAAPRSPPGADRPARADSGGGGGGLGLDGGPGAGEAPDGRRSRGGGGDVRRCRSDGGGADGAAPAREGRRGASARSERAAAGGAGGWEDPGGGGGGAGDGYGGGETAATAGGGYLVRYVRAVAGGAGKGGRGGGWTDGGVAVVVREDGTGEAKYPNGAVAVSVHCSAAAPASGPARAGAGAYTLTALYRNGSVAVTADSRGGVTVMMSDGQVAVGGWAAGAVGRGGVGVVWMGDSESCLRLRAVAPIRPRTRATRRGYLMLRLPCAAVTLCRGYTLLRSLVSLSRLRHLVEGRGHYGRGIVVTRKVTRI